MKKFISFMLGLSIGILSEFTYNQLTLSHTNQNFVPKSYTIVCGYWNKDGVLELVKEN